MAGFGSKILHKPENHSWLSQNLWYFDEIKRSWKPMISFCYFQKKLSFILSVVDAGSVFAQIGS